MNEQGEIERGSAPEQVDRLQHLWSSLSAELQAELAFRWVDRSVRHMLPDGFDRFGHPGLGAVLRTLPTIADRASLHFARVQLSGMKTPDHPADLLAAFFSVAASLEQLERVSDIYESCFLAVMTSRLAYGDDRAIVRMRQDLRSVS